MPDHHRGRRRASYYSDYDDDDDYYSDYEPRARSRSLGRRALDKLEDVIAGITPGGRHDSHDGSHDGSNDGSRAVAHYYPPKRDSDWGRSHRRYHSTSPVRDTHSSRRGRSTRSSHDSGSHHIGSSERNRSRWDRGLVAAAEAAAVEVHRLRHEPGTWTGAKGSRVATAAISAGVIGAATDRRKSEHESTKGGAMGSALGGLIVNRFIHGPRRELRR